MVGCPSVKNATRNPQLAMKISFHSPQRTRSLTEFFFFADCHPEEQCDEGSREALVDVSVDVHEILPPFGRLNDK